MGLLQVSGGENTEGYVTRNLHYIILFRHLKITVKQLPGHGADVKCVHWHPQKALIVSGSKDNQQPIKLWDPKTGQSLATL